MPPISPLHCHEIFLSSDDIVPKKEEKDEGVMPSPRCRPKRSRQDFVPRNFESPLKKRPRVDAKRQPLPIPLNILGQERHAHPMVSAEIKLVSDLLKDKKNASNIRNEAYLFCLQMVDSGLSYQTQLAEIGTLYFYLSKCFFSKDSFFPAPIDGSYMKKREQEIDAIAQSYKSEHKASCPKNQEKLLSSGTTAYILRAFARMIFTPDGSFIVGGCYAVKSLLKTDLLKWISEEQALQIENVVDAIMTKQSICDLLMQSIEIHEEFQKHIKTDLLVRQYEEYSFIYTRWDLLIALFSSIGQVDREENCFAVGITSYLMNNHIEYILKLLIEVLKKGSFTFEGEEIPIFDILEPRRFYEKDFTTSLESQNTLGLPSFSVVKERINPEMSVTVSPGKKRLGDVWRSAFGNQTPEAKGLYLALKMNILQQTALALVQFIALNTQVSYSLPGLACSGKTLLLEKVKRYILNKFKELYILPQYQNSQEMANFVTIFEQRFTSRFWLIDFRNWTYSFNRASGRIEYPFHNAGIEALGRTEDYEAFKFTRRVCFLQNGQFSAVDHISTFGQYLIQLIKGQTLYQDVENAFEQFVQSPQFYSQTGQLIEDCNKGKVALTPRVYERSNSFFLIQRGGRGDLMTRQPALRGHFMEPVHFTFRNPREFFLNLCLKIQTYVFSKIQAFTTPLSKLFSWSEGHEFNVTPYQFREYWQAAVNTLIGERLIQPSQKLLRKRGGMLKARIINYAVGLQRGSEVIIAIQSALGRNASIGNIGMKRFRQLGLQVLRPEFYEIFDNAINETLREVQMVEFKKEIATILSRHQITLNTATLQKVLQNVDTLAKGKCYLIPQKLANITRKALIQNHIAPPQVIEIEKTICRHFGLPESIIIANLNWVGNLSEKPYHQRLVLTVDLATGELVFKKRATKTQDRPYDLQGSKFHLMFEK